MEFKILSCDFSEALYKDPWFFDLEDELPGKCSIAYGELDKFFSNEEYKITGKDGEVVALERSDDFLGYFEFWENCREFGMPNNNGWFNELPWVVDFVKFFNGVSNEIDAYFAKKNK